VYSSYYWDDQINYHEMDRVCRTHGEMRNMYKIFIRKPEGKISLGRPEHRWEANKIGNKETRLEGVHWIHLAQDRDR
jgi:hypothetical protein